MRGVKVDETRALFQTFPFFRIVTCFYFCHGPTSPHDGQLGSMFQSPVWALGPWLPSILRLSDMPTTPSPPPSPPPTPAAQAEAAFNGGKRHRGRQGGVGPFGPPARLRRRSSSARSKCPSPWLAWRFRAMRFLRCVGCPICLHTSGTFGGASEDTPVKVVSSVVQSRPVHLSVFLCWSTCCQGFFSSVHLCCHGEC